MVVIIKRSLEYALLEKKLLAKRLIEGSKKKGKEPYVSSEVSK